MLSSALRGASLRPLRPQPRSHKLLARSPPWTTAVMGSVSGSSRPPGRRDKDNTVLVFDVMDTLVKDPFFSEMPKFFGMTFEDLLRQKHPTAWVEFEKGLITEEELAAKFFADGRQINYPALQSTMASSYKYLEGIEELLVKLKAAGFEMHAMTNYPVWYKLIEANLKLSHYLPWTFVSCEGPMQGLRKPSPESYACVVTTLQKSPSQIIFIDDRQVNITGAAEAGMTALLFEGAEKLVAKLQEEGIEL